MKKTACITLSFVMTSAALAIGTVLAVCNAAVLPWFTHTAMLTGLVLLFVVYCVFSLLLYKKQQLSEKICNGNAVLLLLLSAAVFLLFLAIDGFDRVHLGGGLPIDCLIWLFASFAPVLAAGVFLLIRIQKVV